MADSLTYTGRLVVNTCWCGMRHAIPEELEDFQQRQFNNGERVTSIYCPLGHSYVPSGEGQAEKLRKRLEREQQRNATLLSQLDQETAALLPSVVRQRRSAHEVAAPGLRGRRVQLSRGGGRARCLCTSGVLSQHFAQHERTLR